MGDIGKINGQHTMARQKMYKKFCMFIPILKGLSVVVGNDPQAALSSC